MGQNDERMGVGLSKQKEVGMKGYMAPTMSASSKAIAQRKTILSERNEGSESLNNETQMKTGSALGQNSWDGALSSRQSGSLSVNDGLSIDLYDHLTNYLSPRPKFLRYKPNRSKEIFLRQRNEAGEEKVLFSSGSSSEEISENEQEEEEEEREEEREEIEEGDAEFEEDKGWTLKGVSKFLALLMTTVLYATYLSSTNTNSTSSNGFRPNDVLSNGSCSAQDSKKEAEFTAKLQWGRDFLHWREEEVNENKFFHQEDDPLAEVADGEREVRGFEGEGEEPELENPFHYREPTDRKIFENAIEINDAHKPFSLEVSTAAADQELAKLKTDVPEEMAGSETIDDDHKPFSSDDSTTSELTAGEESAKFKTNSPEKMACSEEIDDDHKPFSIEVSFASEIATDEEWAKSKTEGPEEKARSESYLFLWIQNLKERSYSKNRKIENMNIQIPMSFLAFLVLIVSIVCYRLKKKRAIELANENTMEKISTLTMKPCSEEGRPLASIWLEDKNDVSIERYYNSRAPIVELIGEFVVGGETGKTLKNRIIESKDSNNIVSVEERSVYSRSALSELTNSPLAAKKIVKKEVVEDGRLKSISTPVRRSSRIKNRTALSP